MITMKDLKRRMHAGAQKVCVGFEYTLVSGDRKQVFYFHRTLDEENGSRLNCIWLLHTTIPRTDNKDSENWYLCFEMPKAEMPLYLICATGLRYYQMALKEEIQWKSDMDFAIGNVTAGM